MQQQSNKVLPILVDENIHCRLCKMMYRKSHAQYNLALFFSRCLVLYGVWHPYNYAVTVCYRRSFPLFVFLTQGILHSGMEVYPHPKLIYMQRVMAALLVLVTSCKPALERLKASTGDARPDMSKRQRTTIALSKGWLYYSRSASLPYSSVVFLVRNCNWANQQISDDALQAGHYALHILVHCIGGV